MKRLTNEKISKIDHALNDLICTIKDGAIAICIGIFFVIISCNTSKKTQAQKDAESRQKEIELIEQTRKRLPCDTITTFVNVGVPIQGPRGILIKGDTVFVTDTIYQPRNITKVVIDSALAHERLLEIMQKDYYLGICEEQKDSLADENMKLIEDNQQLRRYKTNWMWLRGVGIGLLALGAIWGFRKQIISLIKRLFI